MWGLRPSLSDADKRHPGFAIAFTPVHHLSGVSGSLPGERGTKIRKITE